MLPSLSSQRITLYMQIPYLKPYRDDNVNSPEAHYNMELDMVTAEAAGDRVDENGKRPSKAGEHE